MATSVLATNNMDSNACPYDLKTNTTQQHHINGMAPPSPELSQEDLVNELSILSSKDINNTTSSDVTGLISPIEEDITTKEDYEDDIIVVGHVEVEQVYQGDEKAELEEVSLYEEDDELTADDLALLIYFEFMDLIYWEIPGRSGIVLGGILSTLVLTRYYSLLYVCAAALTIVTGMNLVFVNVYNLIRTVWTGLPVEEFTHPYHPHIRRDHHTHAHAHSPVNRNITEYYAEKAIDLLELIVQKTAKIVLVEDSKATGFACLLSYLIYVVTSSIPSKIFLGLIILATFTVPYYYEQHQDTVDYHFAVWKKNTNTVVQQYSQVARLHMTTAYDQAVVLKHLVQNLYSAKK